MTGYVRTLVHFGSPEPTPPPAEPTVVEYATRIGLVLPNGVR